MIPFVRLKKSNLLPILDDCLCHSSKSTTAGISNKKRKCLPTVHDVLPETQRTALHMASLNGKYRCINALVKHGAKLDEVDEYGQTALALAILKHNCKVTRILIGLGASKKFLKSEHLETLHDCLRPGNSSNKLFLQNY